MDKIFIGLAGKLASGKGRMSSHLIEKYDAFRLRSSDPLRQTLDLFGVPQSRDNLGALSTFLRSTYGENTICNAMARMLTATESPVAIFDGMRRLMDVSIFRQFPRFYLIYVDASSEVRYDRYIKRNENPGDVEMSREDFDMRDDAEPEQELELLKAHADFVIDNNTNSIEHLDTQIDTVLSTILKK